MTNKKITETTGFWVFVVIAIFLVLTLLAAYWIKYFSNEDYYNYDGKGGEYHIIKSKVGEVIFYSISVMANEKEYIYPFRNHPSNLEDIYMEPDLFDKLVRPKGTRTVFVTRDAELNNVTNGDSVLAAVAFEQILTGNFAIYDMNLTNTYTIKFSDDLSVINCVDTNDYIAVVYLKLGDETKIYSEGDCVIIQGRGGNGLIMAGEKFAYYLLGVF